jgi:hypothetical protein
VDVDRERCDPVEDRKDGEIFLSDRIHLGAIKDGFGLWMLKPEFLQERSLLTHPSLILPCNASQTE